MPLRSLLAAIFFAATLCASAKPSVLVVQRLSKDKEANNIPVGQKLTEQLDIEGRVAPILWSMTDPVFRVYVEEQRLPAFVPNPDDKVIREFASKLKVSYILIVEAIATNDVVRPQATLFDGVMRRRLWSMYRDEKRGTPRLVVSKDGKVDEEATKALREKYSEILSDGTLATMTVLINGKPDWNSTADTLARTWTQLLAEDPLKNHEPQRRIFSPEPGPPLTFKGPLIQQAAPSLAIDDAIVRAQTLVKEDRRDSALLILRDAVDSAPFDIRPRLELIDLLISAGHYRLAAIEADRTVRLSDDQGVVWAKSANAWILAGDADKALASANQAFARGTRDFGIHQVMGEVWLEKGEYEKALSSFEEAISIETSQRAYFGRALAKTFSGDSSGALKDIELAQVSESVSLELYERSILLLDRVVAPTADTLRQIPVMYRKGETDEAFAAAAKIQARISALVEFQIRFKAPERYKLSHETRDLAYKLLKQSSVDALEFAKSGNEDTALESAISLGEALKLLPQIEEQLRIERKNTSVSKTK